MSSNTNSSYLKPLKPWPCQRVYQLYEVCGCSDPIQVYHGSGCACSHYRDDWATEAQRTAGLQKRKGEKCPQTKDIWVIDEDACKKHSLIYFPPPPPHTGEWGSDGTMFGPESVVAEPYMLPEERLDICLPYKEIWEKVAFWDEKIREQRALRKEDEDYEQAVRDEAWDKLVKKQKERDDRDDVPEEERFEIIRPVIPQKNFPPHLQGPRRRF